MTAADPPADTDRAAAGSGEGEVREAQVEQGGVRKQPENVELKRR